MTAAETNKALSALAHYESTGKYIFALVTEHGRTVSTGGPDIMREGISQAEEKLYIHIAH